MTYAEAEKALMTSSPKPGNAHLSNVLLLLERLGNPHHGMKYIHVAGTNGKGTTCALMASVLQAAGYRTGLFTSPHLVKITERFQVNGRQIPEDEFVSLAQEVLRACEKIEAEGAVGFGFFVKVTALGFLWFRKQHCDAVVLEVGLGGRYDATNVIRPEDCALSVFSNIGLDHMELLGHTVAQIAGEKAGILKPGGHAVYYAQSSEAENVILQTAAERKARCARCDHPKIFIRHMGLDGTVFDFDGFQCLHLSLLGEYQAHNAALAVAAVKALRKDGWHISDNALRLGLSTARWPGRMELLCADPPILLDGAHNPQGMEALLKSLDILFPEERPVFVLGVLQDKDYSAELQMLVPRAQAFMTITPPSPRALPADRLAASLRQLGAQAQAFPSMSEALESAKKVGGPICIAGSLYHVAPAYECFS